MGLKLSTCLLVWGDKLWWRLTLLGCCAAAFWLKRGSVHRINTAMFASRKVGLVVAKTHPGRATCVVCLDERLQLIRPTPRQGGNPFWTDAHVAELEVGCQVVYQPTGLLSREISSCENFMWDSPDPINSCHLRLVLVVM